MFRVTHDKKFWKRRVILKVKMPEVYDDEKKIKSHVKWCRRLTRLHERTLKILQEEKNMSHGDEESEEVKADALECPKCVRDTLNAENKEQEAKGPEKYRHIQDLCPADKRRISLLVKHLAKCTKERRETQIQVEVCKAEKEALRNEYRLSLDRQKSENTRLRSKLYETCTELCETKVRISQALELLTRQIAAQEDQFIDLVETVKNLLRERSQLQNFVVQKQTQIDTLTAKIQRMEETLEMERLLHSKERAKSLLGLQRSNKACQTSHGDLHETRNDGVNMKSESRLNEIHSERTKSKDDLERDSTDATLMRDLFFKNPNIDDSESWESIPTLLNPFGLFYRQQNCH